MSTNKRSVVQGVQNHEVAWRVYEGGEVIATFRNQSEAQRYAEGFLTVTRKYHFYSAHRNQDLDDKCFNLHGHLYRMEVTLKFPIPESSVTMLFKDIDKVVDPIIKSYDHKWIVDINDPLYIDIKETLAKHNVAVLEVPFPTSVENLCMHFYDTFTALGLPVSKISIQETESSIVTYEQ